MAHLRLCCLVLGFILVLSCPSPVEGNAGSDYLYQKEWEVQRLQIAIVNNNGRKCESLASCGASNCSRDTCSPLLGDSSPGSMECVDVNNNKYCSLRGISDNTCPSMSFDYRESYIRLPETTNVKSVDTMLAICAQRELDVVMKSISKPEILTRLYFASVDGSWRTYPGSAQGDDCGKFDARVRIWYRTATSVTKVVVILIDIGAPMSNNLGPGLGAGTIFQAAKRIVMESLRTLSGQDYVSIILFDNTRIIPLSPSAVLVQEHNGTIGPELELLQSELNKQTVGAQQGQSDLPGAMSAALRIFDSNQLAAKVAMVISDGVFATLGNVTLPTANLSLLGVKVFLYKLPPPNDKNIYLTNNTLLTQLCSIGGHFEPILRNLENPLLAIRSYFSYLAGLKRALTNDQPQYSYIYEDFDKIGGNITTVAKLAFGSSGELLGVAGITIYMESLGNITDQVRTILQDKNTGNSPLPSPVILTSTNCTIVGKSVEPCGGNFTYIDPYGGLCPRTDNFSSIEKLTCCGGCKLSAPAPSGKPNRLSDKEIVFIVLGSIVGIGVAVGLVTWLTWFGGTLKIKGWVGVIELRIQEKWGELNFTFPEDPRADL